MLVTTFSIAALFVASAISTGGSGHPPWTTFPNNRSPIAGASRSSGFCTRSRVSSATGGSNASGTGAAGTGSVGTGAVGTGAVGTGAVGTGAAGSGAVGTGAVGTGSGGTGSVSTGAVGTGAVGTGAAGTSATGPSATGGITPSGTGSSPSNQTPSATVLNGTYAGVYSSQYNQDFFLGIPYAQPPVNNNRFRVPQSLNTTWSGSLAAAAYSPECVGYGGDQIGYDQSEDCLYLNVVRPAGYEGQALPVAVWIHGGGFYMGGGVDRRYNLSFIIENAVNIGKPFIGVSINYRLSAWGFLSGHAVLGSGNTNLGLRDQRLALHWIQENIAAFGGNPAQVTIWGESAGAMSVGMQLTAYGGRDDALFRAGIMQSGNPIAYRGFNFTDIQQPKYEQIVQQVNCSQSWDTLQCLRDVPFEQLNAVINTTALGYGNWVPYIDGDFIQKYTSIQLEQGQFVKVPIIDGANTDEGTAFGPRGINTTEQFFTYLTEGPNNYGVALPASFANAILEAYPDDPCVGLPATLGCDRPPASFGNQFRRVAAYVGDAMFVAPRRETCQTWAATGVPAYCYRFNAYPLSVPYTIAATHFQEVAYVFHNWNSTGYAVQQFAGKGPEAFALSDLMSSSWASFIVDLDPNSYRAGMVGVGGAPGAWPVYSVSDPMDFVFSENVTSFAEPDTYRAQGMALINANDVLYRR